MMKILERNDSKDVDDDGSVFDDEHPHNESSDDDSSTTSTGSHHTAEEEQAEALKIGEDESKAVTRSQIILMFVLLGVASSVSAAVFLYSRHNETRNFEDQFQMHAEKVIGDIMATTARSLRAIEGFALQLTIQAIDHRMQWPNVVLSDFETRARVTIELAEAISLIFIPIVSEEQKPSWENFSVKNQSWLKHGLAEQKAMEGSANEQRSIDQLLKTYGKDNDLQIPEKIFKLTALGRVQDIGPAPYAPLWQFAPAFPVSSIVNLNTFSLPSRENEVQALIRTGRTIVGKAIDYAVEDSTTGRGAILNLFLNRGASSTTVYSGGPVSDLYSPIFDNMGSKRQIVGMLSSYVYWQVFFENHLPENVNGVFAVLENDCGQTYTFELNGPRATYIGEGDLHDRKYNHLEVATGFGGVFLQDVMDDSSGQCLVNIHIYPSTVLEDSFTSMIPILFTIVLVSTFLFTSLVFIWHQHKVEKRQRVVMKAAVQSTAVVESLFPANVRDRLFEENVVGAAAAGSTPNKGGDTDAKKDGAVMNVNGRKEVVMTSEAIFGSKPIADLFTNTTIMFADMVGFTAWSSVREPTQVFTLLETIYHSFDVKAKRMRVFKVETIGDCYVAVAGLPVPRRDHAVTMAKFATTCLTKMEELAQELETSLGPDTAELCLRIGLHSGPVTAGVLRGDKGRFQLFGDTMNTASRMETTGMPRKIHISRDTADILISAGKNNWIHPREEKVVAKGKGEMQTYWLQIKSDSASSQDSVNSGSVGNHRPGSFLLSKPGSKHNDPSNPLYNGNMLLANISNMDSNKANDMAKTNRLIQWNVDVLGKLLTQIIARRVVTKTGYGGIPGMGGLGGQKKKDCLRIEQVEGKTMLDEVVDIISLPKFNVEMYKQQRDVDEIELPESVNNQLTDLVREVSSMYRNNPFHNFEHASHVTMSVTKLLSRIVNPVEVETGKDEDEDKRAAELHDHTFGITSDPLTQFACVFSALIHDMDHPGVTNAVLVQEKKPEAIKYKNKSVAEQNSVDLAWDLLMQPRFEELRSHIYDNMDELNRFRQLVVNVVMATDIMDKDLGALRKARWEKAFREGACHKNEEDVNRKATIVIEHLIQASDVAHTMQHWHVYQKWNERLFQEMYRAFKTGRLGTDPSAFWYKGEIGFFDFYIVPLARKLETCGVFGVSSDEYLNYALANRREWEERGAEIVLGYIERYKDHVFEEY